MTQEIIVGEYPNDLFLELTGDEYYEYAPSIDTGNCLVFRFVFSSPGDCVIMCNCDQTNGFQLKVESSILKLRVVSSTVSYYLESSISHTLYSFVEVLCNMQNGNGYIYINGEQQSVSNTITGISNVNNNEPVRVGSTILQENTGDVTIGLMSFFTGDDLFTDNSDFISQYNNYVLYYKNDKFPDGGPHAEQLIAEEDQAYFQSPSGTVNLLNQITLDGLTISPSVDFNASNYISGATSVDDFSVAGIGTALSWQQLSEYQADETVLLPHTSTTAGEYLEKTVEYTGALYDDIIIEAVFRINDTVATATYVMDYGDGSPSTNHNISMLVSDDGELILWFNDGNGLEIFDTINEPIDVNTFHHCMVFLCRSTGECSLYIDGTRNRTTGSTPLTGKQLASGDNMYLGYNSSIGNAGTINLAMFRLYQGYEILNGESQYDTLVADRYEAYQDGGIDIHTPIPITVQCWGDDSGTYPIFATLDKDGTWIQHQIGETVSDQQELSFTVENGIYGIRLYSKFENQGYTNWDDIVASYVRIESIQIERKYERVFKRIIAQSKPLSTWALLLIEWV